MSLGMWENVFTVLREWMEVLKLGKELIKNIDFWSFAIERALNDKHMVQGVANSVCENESNIQRRWMPNKNRFRTWGL